MIRSEESNTIMIRDKRGNETVLSLNDFEPITLSQRPAKIDWHIMDERESSRSDEHSGQKNCARIDWTSDKYCEHSHWEGKKITIDFSKTNIYSIFGNWNFKNIKWQGKIQDYIFIFFAKQNFDTFLATFLVCSLSS